MLCLLSTPIVAQPTPVEPVPPASTTTDTTPPPPVTPPIPEVVTPAPPAPKVNLLASGRMADGEWVFFSSKKEALPAETWSVVQVEEKPVLICTGKPHGYVRTKELFTDFEMGVEWKYPTDESGNSGILLFTTGEEHIWPTAIQVQLHQPTIGSIFGSEGGKVETEVRTMNHFSRPVNQWNEILIVSLKGAVTVTINGKEVGTVKVVSPRTGAVGLQSEGSEIHFRNFWIRKLADSTTPTKPDATSPERTTELPATSPTTPGGTSLIPRTGLNPRTGELKPILRFAPTMELPQAYLRGSNLPYSPLFCPSPLAVVPCEVCPTWESRQRMTRKQERHDHADAHREPLATPHCLPGDLSPAVGRRQRTADGHMVFGSPVDLGTRRGRVRH